MDQFRCEVVLNEKPSVVLSGGSLREFQSKSKFDQFSNGIGLKPSDLSVSVVENLKGDELSLRVKFDEFQACEETGALDRQTSLMIYRVYADPEIPSEIVEAELRENGNPLCPSTDAKQFSIEHGTIGFKCRYLGAIGLSLGHQNINDSSALAIESNAVQHARLTIIASRN